MPLDLSSRALSCKPSATLEISAKANKLKSQGYDIVGFGAGEPDFRTPDNIAEAGIEAIRTGFTRYTPASGIQELKEAVCRKFKTYNGIDYKPSQIVISNGGKHGLTNAFTALINPGDEVILPAPYWLSYPEMVKLVDGVCVVVNAKRQNRFKLTAAEIEAAVTDRTKALILNTPGNPTGVIYTRKELEEIAELAVRRNFYVISDEMYEYLVYDGYQHVSIASLGPEIFERTITCSGLSKTYAMTGWRIGYVGAPEPIAKVMAAVQSHQASNPNSIAQKAALEALSGPQDSVEIMRKAFDERRLYMFDRLNAMPDLDVVRPTSAFYVFADFRQVLQKYYKGEKVETVKRLAHILLDDFYVALVPCDGFGAPGYMRFSYAISMEQIKKGLDRIEAFLDSLTAG